MYTDDRYRYLARYALEDTDFGKAETAKILELVKRNKDDLFMWFHHIRNDWKRNRLERNCLID